jgi:hypothetical protein
MDADRIRETGVLYTQISHVQVSLMGTDLTREIGALCTQSLHVKLGLIDTDFGLKLGPYGRKLTHEIRASWT